MATTKKPDSLPEFAIADEDTTEEALAGVLEHEGDDASGELAEGGEQA